MGSQGLMGGSLSSGDHWKYSSVVHVSLACTFKRHVLEHHANMGIPVVISSLGYSGSPCVEHLSGKHLYTNGCTNDGYQIGIASWWIWKGSPSDWFDLICVRDIMRHTSTDGNRSCEELVPLSDSCNQFQVVRDVVSSQICPFRSISSD